MTEQEWLNALPEPMLEFMRDKASARKLRLVALACCRSVWDLLTHSSSRRAVELLEDYVDQETIADGEWRLVNSASREGFHANQTPSCLAANSPRTPTCAAAYAVVKATDESTFAAAATACYQSVNAAVRQKWGTAPGWVTAPGYRAEVDFLERSVLLRDIFGNPFRPVIVDEAVRVNTVVCQLAEAIYQDRAFDRLQILADVLEEAGCRDEALLAHCREPGDHARGWWVLDLLTGRE